MPGCVMLRRPRNDGPICANGPFQVRRLINVSSEVVQKTPARTHQPVAPRIAGTAVPQRVAANTGASGDYNVQLGSYFSMSDANEAWKQFQKRYPEMGDAERVITKARVNGKIYYRVAAAGFAKSSARTLCRSVKGKGGGCIAYASSRPLPGAIDVVDTGMRVAAHAQRRVSSAAHPRLVGRDPTGAERRTCPW